MESRGQLRSQMKFGNEGGGREGCLFFSRFEIENGSNAHYLVDFLQLIAFIRAVLCAL
jgi:hypothetical protein